VVVARALGARHCAQGLVELTTWPRWRKAGATVDCLHAMTGLGLAAVNRRWRLVALLDSSIAAGFAIAQRHGQGAAATARHLRRTGGPT